MAYKLTQADVDKLASLKMFDALEGDIATREEMAALGVQPDVGGNVIPLDQVTKFIQTPEGAENIGAKITSDAGAPFVSPESAAYGADKALGKDPLNASAAKSAPDTSITQAPPASGAGVSDMSGLLSMLAMQPQAQQYSTDPFEGLSRNQKMMLAFSAIKDAGMALQGKEGGAFEKTLGRFNDLRDIERKRQAAQAQRQMLGQIMGGQGMTGGDINSQIQALTQAAMMGLLDPSAVSLAITQLREQQGQQKAQGAVVGGGAGALEDLKRLDEMIRDSGTTTGFTGWLFSKVPFSTATAARDVADTLRSGMALGALKELKAGGATLGSVSEKELALLESAIAKLNLDLPEKDVLSQMSVIEGHYKDAIRRAYSVADESQKAEFDRYFGGQTPAWVLSKETPKPTVPKGPTDDLSEDEKKALGI